MGGPLNRRNWVGSLPCPKSAGFVIDMNAEPHKLLGSGDWTTATISAGMGLSQEGT
jgi:hypothetical protein